MFLPRTHMWVHFQVIPCVTYGGQSCIAAGLSPPSILMHQYTSILVFWTDVLFLPSGLKYMCYSCGRLYTYIARKVHRRWQGDQSG